ncbi:MAG TPA: CAP domain-containing protein [Solirubrobacteraceae bacterium]|nr:CAP domain-containing protein [Solirubrobacteraceae bacterium]
MPLGLRRATAGTRRPAMCMLAIALGCLVLPAIATGTIKRHRHSRGHVSQRRRSLRRWRCSGANLVPDIGDVAVAEQATLCLVNRERVAHDLPALAANGPLDAVASAHSAEMVSRDYFSHRTPSGATAEMRILTSGYVPPSSRVAIGENVATAGGELSTPANVVESWMNSPPHRANILDPSFRASGVGIALGMPLRNADGWQGPGATYTQDLGSYR